ncbi:MAG: hypothetical protein R3C45_04135 [Phycisphaerales bacterium]
MLDLSQSPLPTGNVLGGTRGVELWGNTGVTSLEIDTSGEGKAVFEVTSGSGYLTLSYGSVEQPLNLDLAAARARRDPNPLPAHRCQPESVRVIRSTTFTAGW